MTKSALLVASVIVAGTFALPAQAWAQAARRGGDSGGGSSAPSSPPPSAPSSPAPMAEPRGGSSSSGPVAVPRSPSPSPSNGGSPSGGSGATSSSRPSGYGSGMPRTPGAAAVGGTYGARSGVNAAPVSPADLANRRVQATRTVRGTAQARPAFRGTEFTGGSTSTWYRPRYGLTFGYFGYSPAFWGSTWNRYGWYGYGLYDPYGYDPYLFDPYGYRGAYRYGAYPYYWFNQDRFSDADAPTPRTAVGSLRLKINPKSARVYVDGALAGIADEFDGLSDHLQIEAGAHQIELRADGYDTYTLQVTVEEGRTRTERISLKKR